MATCPVCGKPLQSLSHYHCTKCKAECGAMGHYSPRLGGYTCEVAVDACRQPTQPDRRNAMPQSLGEVYNAITNERAYQLARWGRRQPGCSSFKEDPHTVGDFIAFMEHYLFEARKALSTQSGHNGALDELRKVVALGVACFQQHGVPPRIQGGTVINGHDRLPA